MPTSQRIANKWIQRSSEYDLSRERANEVSLLVAGDGSGNTIVRVSLGKFQIRCGEVLAPPLQLFNVVRRGYLHAYIQHSYLQSENVRATRSTNTAAVNWTIVASVARCAACLVI